jgi:hypothetical protein
MPGARILPGAEKPAPPLVILSNAKDLLSASIDKNDREWGSSENLVKPPSERNLLTPTIQRAKTGAIAPIMTP